MLSRRNVRVKVMQSLYAMNRDKELSFFQVKKNYFLSVGQSYDIYLFNLWILGRIADFSRAELSRKRSKYLPSEEDMAFKDDLATNPISALLIRSQELSKECKDLGISTNIDADNIRKLYKEFEESDPYKEYLKRTAVTTEEHVQILLDLYKFCINHELFVDMIEDRYFTWLDDKSIVVGSVKRTIKALPISEEDFFKAYKPDLETTEEFGLELMEYVHENSADLESIIEPMLENWEMNRVAVLDMIILKMAIAEILIFPTIPTKVSLNEYVDLSKLYSTDKSKEFINGVLDRTVKKLVKENKIQKEGRGLID